MSNSKTMCTFDINEHFMNQWFDSFHPSIKTYVTNYIINTLRQYDFSVDAIEDKEERSFAIMLMSHFGAFLKLKMMDENPGHVITGIYLPLE